MISTVNASPLTSPTFSIFGVSGNCFQTASNLLLFFMFVNLFLLPPCQQSCRNLSILLSRLLQLYHFFLSNYMNKLKVTKLKITPTALEQLQQLHCRWLIWT